MKEGRPPYETPNKPGSKKGAGAHSLDVDDHENPDYESIRIIEESCDVCDCEEGCDWDGQDEYESYDMSDLISVQSDSDEAGIDALSDSDGSDGGFRVMSMPKARMEVSPTTTRTPMRQSFTSLSRAPTPPASWQLGSEAGKSSVSGAEAVTNEVDKAINALKRQMAESGREDDGWKTAGPSTARTRKISATPQPQEVTPPGLSDRRVECYNSVYMSMMSGDASTDRYVSPKNGPEIFAMSPPTSARQSEMSSVGYPRTPVVRRMRTTTAAEKKPEVLRESIGVQAEVERSVKGRNAETQTDLSLSVCQDMVTWTPAIKKVRVDEEEIEGSDANIELAIAAQQRDIIPERTIDSAAMRGESSEGEGDDEEGVGDVGMDDQDEEAGSQGDVNITEIVQKFEEMQMPSDGPVATIEPLPEKPSNDRPQAKRATHPRTIGKNSVPKLFAAFQAGSCKDPGCEDPSCENLSMPVDTAEAERKPKKKVSMMRMRRGKTMDTGAHHNVMTRRMAGKREVRPSEGSRKGLNYVAASDHRIPNEGEVTFDFTSVEGHKEAFVFQIAEVNKALGSVAYVVDRDFRIVFDQNTNTGEYLSYMVHKPTKKSFRFRRERSVWILDAMVTPESIFGQDFARPE